MNANVLYTSFKSSFHQLSKWFEFGVFHGIFGHINVMRNFSRAMCVSVCIFIAYVYNACIYTHYDKYIDTRATNCMATAIRLCVCVYLCTCTRMCSMFIYIYASILFGVDWEAFVAIVSPQNTIAKITMNNTKSATVFFSTGSLYLNIFGWLADLRIVSVCKRACFEAWMAIDSAVIAL